MSDVTRILTQIESGDPSAADQLLPLVYDELRKLAAAKLADEKPGQTLQATALVHEAYLRLVGDGQKNGWNGRGHFFGAAAESMRRILVEKARQRTRIRHGGIMQRVDFERVDTAAQADDERLLALNEALDQLATEDPNIVEIVKLRYFAGLTIEQAAEVAGVSVRTANRQWAYARAWLFKLLR